jgi:hypothetical protein
MRSDIHRMTRIALIALGVLLGLGILISVLPVSNKEPLGDVLLEGVNLELYPAADSDAKWVFRASNVSYSPETRESTVKLEGTGKRVLKGKTDLELRAPEITIDGNDNIRVQVAMAYIPDGCYVLKLGQPSGQPVVIDQNAGYRAPYAEFNFQNGFQIGDDFTSNFAVDNISMAQRKFQLDSLGKETCSSVLKRTGWQ